MSWQAFVTFVSTYLALTGTHACIITWTINWTIFRTFAFWNTWYVMYFENAGLATFFELYLNNLGAGRILSYIPYIGLPQSFLCKNRFHWHHNLNPLSHQDHIDRLKKNTIKTFMLKVFYFLERMNLHREERNGVHLCKYHIYPR